MRHIAQTMWTLFKANDPDGWAWHQTQFTFGEPPRFFCDDRNIFNADWSKSRELSAIARKHPYMRFFVLYRPVHACCESLLNYHLQPRSQQNPAPHPDSGLPHEKLVDKYWISTYRGIMHEMQSIWPKPHVLHFEQYISGAYNELILDAYGFEHSPANTALLADCIARPANSVRHEVPLDISEKLISDCAVMGSRLAAPSQESWVTQELYSTHGP